MTDSHPLSAPPGSNPPTANGLTAGHRTHPGHGPYDGTDPELSHSAEHKRGVKVSTVQVGASAAAAVTSALAASFFGVAGTLIGAAVGSIVSTVAGALYAEYMKRAGEHLRGTTAVVIQRIPSEVLATTPLRHLTGPTDLPGEESLRPVGDESAEESIELPLAAKRDLLAEMDGTALPPTDVPVGAAVPAESAPTLPNGSTAASAGASPAAKRPTRPIAAPSKAWYKRPLVTLPAIAVSAFAISLGVVTATEGAAGHPLSGGSGGTSLGKAFSHSSSTKATPTPTTSATPTAKASPRSATRPSAAATTAAPVRTTAPAATTAPPTTAAATGSAVAPQATSTP